MKKIIAFLILIFLAICAHSDNKRDIIQKRRMKDEKILKECILTNGSASPQLKKIVEETKEGELRRNLHPRYIQEITVDDSDLIRDCRKKVVEDHIKEREIEREKMKKGHSDL